MRGRECGAREGRMGGRGDERERRNEGGQGWRIKVCDLPVLGVVLRTPPDYLDGAAIKGRDGIEMGSRWDRKEEEGKEVRKEERRGMAEKVDGRWAAATEGDRR